MGNYETLRAAVSGTAKDVIVPRMDLAEMIQELDCLRAGGATKRGKKEYPADFLEAYDAMKAAGGRWRDGSTPAAAFDQWKKRMKAGAAPADMVAGAHRYAVYCKANPDNPVLMAQTFFGPQERYTAEYTIQRAQVPRRMGPADRRPTLDERRQQANAEAVRILDGVPTFNDDGMTIDAQ